jgi:IMP dehydrogenase
MTQAWTETEKEVIETRGELRNRLGSVLEKGEIAEERREEIINAFDVGDKSVSEVMVSPEDIVYLSTEDTERNFEKMEEYPHTRYPLVGDSIKDFRGVVYTPILVRHREDLSSGELDFEDLSAPTMTLSPDTDVSDAIDQFQTERQELALVIEDGEVVGLVTVTDLLETVVGDMEDPLD